MKVKNISMSSDGGAVRDGPSLYTVHAATPSGQMLLEARECLDVSHTGDGLHACSTLTSASKSAVLLVSSRGSKLSVLAGVLCRGAHRHSSRRFFICTPQDPACSSSPADFPLILILEVTHSANECLRQFKKKPVTFIRLFMAQFAAYVQGVHPLATGLHPGQTVTPLECWTIFERSAVGVKLFSTVLHSMPDERIMPSYITMLNTAQCSRQNVNTVAAMAQVRGLYMVEEPERVQKRARDHYLHLPFTLTPEILGLALIADRQVLYRWFNVQRSSTGNEIGFRRNGGPCPTELGQDRRNPPAFYHDVGDGLPVSAGDNGCARYEAPLNPSLAAPCRKRERQDNTMPWCIVGKGCYRRNHRSDK
ncbi:hypothetical protein NMY22_g4645 [Coprinellus aureogranulatus]|nr:hypothetical protein NMY22_g4645 [Coprinellus aureogranulatus]